MMIPFGFLNPNFILGLIVGAALGHPVFTFLSKTLDYVRGYLAG